MINKILRLMENYNINANQLTKECELSHTAITDWKKGKAKPSAEALAKIADYFNVSVDYLMGRTEEPTFQPTPITKNTVVAIARGGDKIEYDFSDEELAAIKNLLDTMKKK